MTSVHPGLPWSQLKRGLFHAPLLRLWRAFCAARQRFVPNRNSCTATIPSSFRPPGRRGQAASQVLRCRASCRFQIDHQFKFDRSDHRQVRRIFTLQNSARIDANLAESIDNAFSVAYEAALYELRPFPHRRQAVFGSERNEFVATAHKERIGGDQKHLGSSLHKAASMSVSPLTPPT
jgi:hypothetical protein